MFTNFLKIGLLSVILVSGLNAKGWMVCAVDVCRNMSISSSTPYDCWDKLADKYAKGRSGKSIVYPMCEVAKVLNTKYSKNSLNTVGNCSAAIAKSMGIYLSKGSIGESMCKIADKVKKTKSLK